MDENIEEKEDVYVDSHGNRFVEKVKPKKTKGVHTFSKDPHDVSINRIKCCTWDSFFNLGDKHVSIVVDIDNGDLYYFDSMNPPLDENGVAHANLAFHKIPSGFPNCTIKVCKVVKDADTKDKETSVLFQGAHEHNIDSRWKDAVKHHQRME